jgi:hypothetical protein
MHFELEVRATLADLEAGLGLAALRLLDPADNFPRSHKKSLTARQ